MENYFYLFGFIYLLILARKIYGYTIPLKEEDAITLDENTTITDLMDVKEKSDSKPKKNPIWTILDIACLCWLFIGFTNNQSDKTLFLFLFTLIVAYYIFVIGIIAYSVFMVVFGGNLKTKVTTSKKTKSIQLTKTIVITEFIILFLILVKHYFSL